MVLISNARCVTNTQSMKKMIQFARILYVQAIKINPIETLIIATMEHLMVNFRQKTVQIVTQKYFMKISLRMGYA